MCNQLQLLTPGTQTGKLTPYDEDVRVPLYARGPGIPKGIELAHLVSNIDLAPTWLDLAGGLGMGDSSRLTEG